MWRFEAESLNKTQQRLRFFNAGIPASFRTVIEHWRHDEAFRSLFIDSLATCQYTAFFWETPGVTRNSLEQEFECVLVDSPQLADAVADATPFKRHLNTSSEYAVTFSNLGNDAMLVAPCPRTSPNAYPHIAAFSRRAPRDQQHALWQKVGETLVSRLANTPLWTSTSGLGVYWLHIRLDSFPKYYTYTPFRTFTRSG